MILDTRALTLTEARQHLAARDFSARELAEAHLGTIEARDVDVHAYLEVFDDVLEQAEAADRRLATGNAPELTGMPLALKDNILIEGRHVSAGSKILEGYVASYDAGVTGLLKKAGVVFMGRTNMDEFAMGGSTERSAYGITRNPCDLSRVPGGSSGGSAAAVAMGGAIAALGSDTGGSVRQPASFCGVAGLKPTYGALSRSGLIAMGSSLDQIGPIGKTVVDVALLFRALRANDPNDSTSLPESAYPVEETREAKRGLTIGVPRSFLVEGVSPDVLSSFDAALARLRERGYALRDIELSHAPHALAVYYILMPAEASTNLARFDGVRYGVLREGDDLLGDYRATREEGLGEEVRRRIILGTYVLSAGYYDAYYRTATAVRALIREDFRRAFTDVDIIATPSTPTPAFKIGEKMNDPLAMYAADLFTVPANIAGIPALSVPCDALDGGDGTLLPVGIQFMAPHCREDLLFMAGLALEESSRRS